MAVAAITVNEYNKPAGVNAADVVEVTKNFNADPVVSFCEKYIGQNRTCNRDLIKKVRSGVEELSYTIHFAIVKSGNEPAKISYTFSSPDAIIISSEQEYEKAEDFVEDINFINESIEKIFA